MWVALVSVLGLASAHDEVSRGMLPSIPADTSASWLQEHAAWWVQVKDEIYHSPPVSLIQTTGLSSSISDYFYALGSHGGLTSELEAHRVGGKGRVHLFHLPGGPSSLKMPMKIGSRRASLSMLQSLEHGKVLTDVFPAYQLDKGYKNPLSSKGQAVEQQVASSINAGSVMSELNGLLAEPTRAWDNPAETDKAVHFVEQEFRSMGFTTCAQPVPGHEQLENIVAYLPGQPGQQSSITLGAHYDSRPYEGKAPGAVDNGSGVAGLLAVGRALSKAKVQPVKPVYLVAFAAEEPGLWGSKGFVQDLKAGNLPEKCRIGAAHSFLAIKNRRSKAGSHEAIIMDEVAWKSTHTNLFPKTTVNLESFDTSKEVMDHLAQANKDHNGDSVYIVHSNNPFGSDHMSFLDNGFQGVLTIQGDDEGYPDYHKSSDEVRNVNPEMLSSVARMNAAAVMRLAGVQ